MVLFGVIYGLKKLCLVILNNGQYFGRKPPTAPGGAQISFPTKNNRNTGQRTKIPKKDVNYCLFCQFMLKMLKCSYAHNAQNSEICNNSKFPRNYLAKSKNKQKYYTSS